MFSSRAEVILKYSLIIALIFEFLFILSVWGKPHFKVLPNFFLYNLWWRVFSTLSNKNLFIYRPACVFVRTHVCVVHASACGQWDGGEWNKMRFTNLHFTVHVCNVNKKVKNCVHKSFVWLLTFELYKKCNKSCFFFFLSFSERVRVETSSLYGERREMTSSHGLSTCAPM